MVWFVESGDQVINALTKSINRKQDWKTQVDAKLQPQLWPQVFI